MQRNAQTPPLPPTAPIPTPPSHSQLPPPPPPQARPADNWLKAEPFIAAGAKVLVLVEKQPLPAHALLDQLRANGVETLGIDSLMLNAESDTSHLLERGHKMTLDTRHVPKHTKRMKQASTHS